MRGHITGYLTDLVSLFSTFWIPTELCFSRLILDSNLFELPCENQRESELNVATSLLVSGGQAFAGGYPKAKERQSDALHTTRRKPGSYRVSRRRQASRLRHDYKNNFCHACLCIPQMAPQRHSTTNKSTTLDAITNSPVMNR